MKVFIVKLTLPKSWSNVDVVCALNIGLQDHYHSNRSAAFRSLRAVLDQPVNGAANVIAVIPMHGEDTKLKEER